jgi:hypothetical protein
VDFYGRTLARSADALRASSEFYRAIDEIMEQNERRRAHPLSIPVLTLAGDQRLRPPGRRDRPAHRGRPGQRDRRQLWPLSARGAARSPLAELIPFLAPDRNG